MPRWPSGATRDRASGVLIPSAGLLRLRPVADGFSVRAGAARSLVTLARHAPDAAVATRGVPPLTVFLCSHSHLMLALICPWPQEPQGRLKSRKIKSGLNTEFHDHSISQGFSRSPD